MLPRKWRPYLQAREFARKLEIASYREWTRFSASGERPADIPANPWQAYGKDFGGYPDFLGTDRTAFCPLPSDVLTGTPSKQAQTISRGMSTFVDLQREFAPKYKLEALPWNASATFMLGRNDSLGQYTPLSVSLVEKTENVTTFNGLQRRKATKYRVGFEVSEPSLYLFPANSPRWANSVAITDGYHTYDEFRMEIHNLAGIFDRHWHDQERYSRQKLLGEYLFHNENDVCWIKVLLQLDQSLFSPLGLDFSFPDRQVGGVTNISIDGIPVVYRFSTIRGAGYNIDLTKYVRRVEASLHVEDDFEFVLSPVRAQKSNDVLGLYLFPKELLISRNCLRNVGLQVQGIRNLRTYPPWITPTERRGKEKQQWQNEHYYDLSSETAIKQSRIRFSNVLKRIQ